MVLSNGKKVVPEPSRRAAGVAIPVSIRCWCGGEGRNFVSSSGGCRTRPTCAALLAAEGIHPAGDGETWMQ